MIELINVCKSFGKKEIFHNFSIKIQDRSFALITGESGCGKTTLLDMIGDLEKPDSGIILIDGKSLEQIPQRNYFRDVVGFLFQNFALMENRTVRQNLDIISKRNRSEISAAEALERVGLSGMESAKVYQLSGGEQQRVALARLMIKKCSLILADEPTGSLDEKNGRIVINLLKEFRDEGKSVVMVTHNRDYLAEADQVIELTDTVSEI